MQEIHGPQVFYEVVQRNIYPQTHLPISMP